MADNPITQDKNVVLFDDLGNKINVILNNGIYRLENRAAITSPNGAKDVSVITDGANERLAVDAKIVGGTFQLQPFTPVILFDSAGTSLAASPTWTTLYNVTATQGKLDFIAVAGSLANYRIRLTVDTVIIFNVAMSDISAIGLSNATNVPMWAETADKNFRYRPAEGVDFTSSFQVEGQLTAGSVTVKTMVHYRKI